MSVSVLFRWNSSLRRMEDSTKICRTFGELNLFGEIELRTSLPYHVRAYSCFFCGNELMPVHA